MSQLGLHGITGLAAVRLLSAARPSAAAARTSAPAARGALAYGIVLGGILPDADFFLLGPLYLIDAKLGLAMHRTWSHSLITAAFLTIGIALMASFRRDAGLRSLGLGLGLGIALHSAADIFLWFTGIHLFWPLGRFGLPQEVNLWTWLRPPRVVSNLLGAADYLAFALYYVYLARLARRFGTNLDFLPRLGLFARVNWLLWAVYTGLAFVLGGWFDIAHYALFILIFLPICLYVTGRMRPTIERYGTAPAAGTAANPVDAPG